MVHFIMTVKYGMRFAELNAEKYPIKCDFQFMSATDIGVASAEFQIDTQIWK